MFSLIYGAYVDLPRRYKALLYLLGGLVCFGGAFLVQSGAPPQSDVMQTVARVGAVFLGLTAFALIVGVIAGADEERLFRKCLEAFEDRVRHQREKGIYGIRPGGKLYDFLRAVEYEEGDQIDVLWSYLQHEEVTERIFEEVRSRRLSVRFLLLMPFSEGLELRVRDLARDYSGDLFEYLHEKSLGNVQFLRRYLQSLKERMKSAESNSLAHSFSSDTYRYEDSRLQAISGPLRSAQSELQADQDAISEITLKIQGADSEAQGKVDPDDVKLLRDQLASYEEKKRIGLARVQQEEEEWERSKGRLKSQPQSMELRYTEQYFARPMVIRNRRNKDGKLDVVSVAMGFFLTDEASKYPIMVFRNEDVGQARNVCEDAATYFNNKYKDAFFGRSFWEAVRDNVARQPRGAFLRDDVQNWERMIAEICLSADREDRPGEWRDARLDPPTL